jgi:hypothetical protein
MAARTQKGLVGAAGEYHVAAELSRRGWLATVTIKNSPGTDVLAQLLETQRMVAIQPKTTFGESKFRLKDLDERPARNDNEWYVFVRLNGDFDRPDFYVVPRDVIAGCIYAGHR